MTGAQAEERTNELVQEYELDAPPSKVWRAISIAEFRETWLPNDALADAEPEFVAVEREVRYRMRESEPPFLESAVTFQIAPGVAGGTRLRIIHELSAAPLERAANDNVMSMMLAA